MRHRRHGRFKTAKQSAMASNGRTTTRHGNNLAFDFDLEDSRAQFAEIDPDDARVHQRGRTSWCKPGRGKLVPEAVKVVISSGVTLHDYEGFRRVAPALLWSADLTSDGIFRSNATALLNGEAGYQIRKKWRVSAEF